MLFYTRHSLLFSSGMPAPPTTDNKAELPLPSLVLPPRQLRKIHISCKKWLARFFLTFSSVSGAKQAGAAVAAAGAGSASSFSTTNLVLIRFDDDDNNYGVFRRARCVCPHWKEASGFVVLNGGILAGCSPQDLRNTLLTHKLINAPLPSSAETILEYGSTLPFVLCSRRLAVEGRGEDSTAAGIGGEDSAAGLSALYVPVTELRRFAASTRASSEVDASAASASDPVAFHRQTVLDTKAVDDAVLSEECGAACSSSPASFLPPQQLIGVAVLQLPPSACLWKGGSAASAAIAAATVPSSSPANRGCGFLYLLPCDVALVRAVLGHVFQKPVLGIESLLRKTIGPIASVEVDGRMRQDDDQREGDAEVEESAAPQQRICVSKALPGIPGLYIVEDFITKEEEAAIWRELHLNRQQLHLEYLSRRRVAHFNRRFIYGANQLTSEGEEVNARPTFYTWMRARLQNDDPARSMRIVGNFPFVPGEYECDQLTVNYYDYSEMGACGIATHVDAHNAFDDAILIVSLGSYTVMDFAPWDTPAEVAAPTGVFLPPRSLAVMSGASRYGWTHCIAEKRTDTISELLPTLTRGDRLSLTWRRGRTKRHFKAECPFPTLCDGE